MKRWAWLRWLIGISISALFVWLVLRGTDLGQVGHSLRTANPLYLVPAALANGLTLVLRGWRWQLCFDPEDEVSFGEAFGAYSLGAASSIVISRAGDLVRVYILGQANGVSKSKGLGTLVVERLADLFTVVLLVAALLPLFPVPSWIRLSDAFGAAVAVAALAIIYPLSRSSSRLRPPAWIEQRRLTQAAFGLLVQMLNGFSAVKDIRRALLILVSSAAVWFVQIISYAVLFPGVGIPLGLREG